jgi:chromosome segregation ATPase
VYLQELVLKNFRCFDGNENKITFNHGLTVLVGENDSGKSAIMALVLETFNRIHNIKAILKYL